ncbi:hypothetical protein NG895_18375 [Aeoliella sp. ICT_H6.2]|uniref:Uncharacterized protein n=1 Tax=Aeoliella straminimaris TaxID=2954799 RepID=A0A9X2FBL5_9BACT|nr:hypothetical protein [Aeoliella straminimaris]MCO6045870.1 hypothetical protein [Aeoliella straminimaris]
MRLTLRTLLAYMDDILDPENQENLAKQVSESEKASELIHRTRDATRRLRLGAPPVFGDGMELDPNYAAEYLDSTLSGDDMSEYQQVCLDSDVHLAEVASCHHILTMVLGEPAEIDSDMRQKMYGIPGSIDEWHQSRVDTAHTPVVETTPVAPVVHPQALGQDEPVTEVPAYLKTESSSGGRQMAMAFAAALALGFVAFMLFRPGGLLSGNQEVAQEDPAASQNEPVENLATPDATTPDATATAASPPGPEKLAVEDGPADEPVETATAPPEDGSSSSEEVIADTPPNTPPADPQPQDSTPQDSVVDASPMQNETPAAGTPNDSDLPPVTPPTDPTTNNAVADAPIVTPPIEDGTTEPGDVAPEEPIKVASNDSNMTTPPVNDTSMEKTTEEVTAEAPAEPPEAPPIGTMVATDQVLLRLDDATSDWFRLPPRSSVMAGDPLLSLPTFRPSLALVSVLRVELCDGAMAKVDYADDGKTPRLELAYGRFLLQNTGMQSTKVQLVVSGETRTVELASTGVLGLDVDRPFVPGADVESSLGEFVATFYAPNGRVVWDTEGAALTVDQPAQWSWKEGTPKSITDNVEWLNGQSLDYLQQNVSRYFEKQLNSDQPARVQLLELYESSRRREDKALAAVCGTHVGQFVPFVQALADTQQQSSWEEHIAELRRAMSRSTQAAKLVHQTLIEQRGGALADDLFEMLRGYTPEQIGTTPEQVQAGVTRQLIEWLKHNRLEYRVLAIHNLKQIYGGKTLGYNPVVTEPARQDRAVKQWRSRLADNELVPTFAAKN